MKHNRKVVCVIGLGSFGMQLARSLAQHCEVFAVDSSEEAVDAVSEHVQRAICLDAREYQSLAAVVTPDFDEAIVGIGGSLEASILTTVNLKRIGVRRIWGKATNDDQANILRSVGAHDVIFPEREAAERLASRIANPNLLDFIPLADDYVVMDLAAPKSFVGKSLMDLQLPKQLGAFVIAVKVDNGTNFRFLPGPHHVVKADEVLVLIGKQEKLVSLQSEE